MTAPSPNLPPSTDTVRHHWASDLQSIGKLQITSPHFQESEPWLKDGVNAWAVTEEKATQKDASFFPLSAFLAGPSTAEQRTPAGKPTVPILDRETQIPHTSSITTSSAPQETAAAAACRALASHDIPSATSTEQRGRLAAIQNSPQEATIPQLPPAFSTARDMFYTPCSITPSHAATPKLTTAIAPMLESPLLLESCIQRGGAEKQSPPHLTSSSEIRCRPIFGRDDGHGHNLSSIWDTVPIETPRKSLHQVRSSTLNASSPPTRFSKIFQSQASFNDPTTDEGFFEMGHGKPCWCSYFYTSHSNDTGDCSVNVPLEQPINSPNTDRKRKGVEPTETMSPVELKPLHLAAPPTNSDSDFEHLSANDADLCSPITDDCWTMVTSDMPSKSADTTASPASDHATEVDVMSWPSSPSDHTTDGPVPFAELDIEALFGKFPKLDSSFSLAEVWPALPASTPLTPAAAVTFTEPPLGTSTETEGGIMIRTASSAADDQSRDPQPSIDSPLIDAFNVWSLSPQNHTQAPGTATTSSTEWPTLSEAVGLKRRRMCVESSLDDDVESWDDFAEWSVL